MTIKDRIILMEEIWSTLRDSDVSEIDSPEWHGKTLRARRKKIENGTATFISIDQLKSKG